MSGIRPPSHTPSAGVKPADDTAGTSSKPASPGRELNRGGAPGHRPPPLPSSTPTSDSDAPLLRRTRSSPPNKPKPGTDPASTFYLPLDTPSSSLSPSLPRPQQPIHPATVPGAPQAAQPPTPGPLEIVVEQPAAPLSPVDQARARLTNLLGAMDMPVAMQRDPQQRTRQTTLEQAYIAAKAPTLAARKKVFGNEFTPLRDVPTQFKAAAPTVVVEAVKGGLSSASRSPLVAFLVTRLGPEQSELRFGYDAAVVATPLGGASAYSMENLLLKGIDRRAAAHNLATLKAVDVKALIPDPSRVALSVQQGADDPQPTKVFRELSDVEFAQARTQAMNQRARLEQAQTTLAGGGSLLHFTQGALGGTFNVARRAWSTAEALKNPYKVGAWVTLASGAAGFATKGGYTATKALPKLSQTKIDNFMGGTQKANLFALKKPKPDQAMAQMSTLGTIGKESLVEAASLAGHFVDVRRGTGAMARQLVSASAYAAGNLFGMISAYGTGPFLASLKRGGNLDPMPGESSRSGANLLQQFGQSGMNDPAWNAFKDKLAKGYEYDLGASLDLSRDTKDKTLAQTATQAQQRAAGMAAELGDLARALHPVPVPPPQGQAALVAHGDPAQAVMASVRRVTEVLNAPQPTSVNVRGALDALETLRRDPELARVANEIRADMLPMWKALAQREHLAAWRNGPAAPAPVDRAR